MIGFGELDYLAREVDGVARVILSRLDPSTEDVTLSLMAVRFDEFFVDMGRNLSSEFDQVSIPDPAECKSSLTS